MHTPPRWWKNLRTRDLQAKDHRNSAMGSEGSSGLLYSIFVNTWTNGDWVWEWHLQGTCRELRLRLLPSNVNCGQRHRELSAIKNTLAWNRNTHKAYGINTTKEDFRTRLSLLCRAMRFKNDTGELNSLPSLQDNAWGNGSRHHLTSLSKS